MAEKEGSFRKLLNLARFDSLPDRESRIFALRYGLTDGKVHTLAETGRHFGISRERSRKIILRAHQAIVSKALSQLKNDLFDQPCAKLASYTRGYIRPECEKAAQRMITLFQQEFQALNPSPGVIKFIASIAYPDIELAEDDINTALQVLREQHFVPVKRDFAIMRFKKLLSYVVWPAKPSKLTDEEIAGIWQPVKESLATDVSSFYSDKMGRFVKFSSGLELKFYKLLEYVGDVVEYHEHCFGVIYQIEGQRLIYYPDLFVVLRDRRGILVEIIPVFYMALWRNLVRFEVLRNYCLKNCLGLLVTDGYGCLEQMCHYKVNQRYASDVMRYLRKKGTLDWNTYKRIKDKYRPNRNDFVGLIVQNRLVWQLGPFRLSLSNSAT